MSSSPAAIEDENSLLQEMVHHSQGVLQLGQSRMLNPDYEVDFVVTRDQLLAAVGFGGTGNGLAYQKSMSFGDKDPNEEVSLWGSTVRGLPIGENWVKVGNRFLPVRVQGKQVLERKTEDQAPSKFTASSLVRTKQLQPPENEEQIVEDEQVEEEQEATDAETTGQQATEQEVTAQEQEATGTEAAEQEATEQEVVGPDNNEQTASEAEGDEQEAAELDSTEAEVTLPEGAEQEATGTEAAEQEATEQEVVGPDNNEQTAPEAEGDEQEAAELDSAEAEVTVPEGAEQEVAEVDAGVPEEVEPVSPEQANANHGDGVQNGEKSGSIRTAFAPAAFITMTMLALTV